MSGVRVTGLVLLTLAVAAAAATAGYPVGREGVPGPALFPRAVAALLALCAVALVWQGTLTPPAVAPAGRARAIAWTMVLLVAYVATWEVVPFVPRTLLLLLVFLRLLDVSWRGAVIASVTLSTAIFVVFERLLAVRL